jgi:hypothetical protein
MTSFLAFLIGLGIGLFLFIGYLSYRALRSGHWDTSNLLNVLRLISFVATHPEVFPYLVDSRLLSQPPFEVERRGKNTKMWPFWYLPHDEFKEVVKTI